MTGPRVLLVNPTIASPRSARFPLAVLTLSAALEGRCDTVLLDGNVDLRFVSTARAKVAAERFAAVGISVMGGPQLQSAIAVSRAIRAASPATPIVWGGYFPTICPDAALNADYVDYVVRGQGEGPFVELVSALAAGRRDGLADVAGVSRRGADGAVHNPDRAFSAASLARGLPYDRLENPRRYLGKTYLGQRTTGYQAALGCRFRCTFCGVAALFRGKTALPAADRLEHDVRYLKHGLGADSVQFYDHNFFDRETDMVPLLEILARHELPWWCYARSDALVNMSPSSWALVRKSRLRMAYIGAESPSDDVLHDVRKGTRADQTLAAVERCRANGVIPELSFMLAPPHDPEAETEKTFDFIRAIKKLHPASEIMLYIHTPLPPPRDGAPAKRSARPLHDYRGEPVEFPDSADGWAEPRWIDYWCHRNAPWVTPALRRRITDFTTVLACRYPTITDVRSPRWGKAALRTLSSWRYRFGRYGHPWELDVSKRFVKLWDPRVSGL